MSDPASVEAAVSLPGASLVRSELTNIRRIVGAVAVHEQVLSLHMDKTTRRSRHPRDGLADPSGVGRLGAFHEIRAGHRQPAWMGMAGFWPPGPSGGCSTLMSYLVGGSGARWVTPA